MQTTSAPSSTSFWTTLSCQMNDKPSGLYACAMMASHAHMSVLCSHMQRNCSAFTTDIYIRAKRSKFLDSR